VEEARGAFTRADAMIQGLAPSARLNPIWSPSGLAFGLVRGEMDDEEATDGDPEAVHEGAVHAEGLPDVDFLCSEEEGAGSLTLSMETPCEVCLVTAEGASLPVEMAAGEDRYYAMAAGIPPGEYFVAILRPKDSAPNPPSA
jgi:hypothetical protein